MDTTASFRTTPKNQHICEDELNFCKSPAHLSSPLFLKSVSSATVSPGKGKGDLSCDAPLLKNSIHAIRTISIVAHIDAGKTTTTERMLYYAGVVKRVGDVDSGTTTTDYMQDEMERGITIQSALVTLRWQGHPIYLLDTPGHADFTVEVERSVRVVDGVVALLDASAGVQAQSYVVLSQSIKYGVPVVFFINKMDKFNANFDMSVKSIEEKLKIESLLLQFPLKGDDGEFTGVIDLVQLQCYRFGGHHGEVVECTPIFKGGKQLSSVAVERNSVLGEGQLQEVLACRHQLLIQLTAVDDILSEQFITALDEADGNEERVEITLPSEFIQAAIRRVMITPPSSSSNGSTREGRPRRILCPVLCGAARKDIGVQPLLDAIVDYLPSPLERNLSGVNASGLPVTMPMKALVHSPSSSSFFSFPAVFSSPSTAALHMPPPAKEASVLLEMPFWALAFKVCHTTNPASGKREALVYIRIFSGVLRSTGGGARGSMRGASAGARVLQNRSQGVEERVGALYVLHANTPIEVDALRPGEVGALFLKKTYTGDTLYAPPHIPFGSAPKTDGKGVGSGCYHRSSSSPVSFSEANKVIDGVKEKVQLVKNVQDCLTSKTPSGTATPTRAGVALTSTELPSNSSKDVETFPDEVYLLEGISTPPPVLSYSIEAATAGQAQRLDAALLELTREDPSLSFHTDDYGNRVLQGLGELHLEIALSRLRHEYALQCRLLHALVEYRETFLSSRRVDHISVSSDHPGGSPYAELTLSVDPCHHWDRNSQRGEKPEELMMRDKTSAEGCDEEDEGFYASSATPQFILSSSLFSAGEDPPLSASSGGIAMSSVGARIEEKKRLREWARALEESFQHSIMETSRLGPLAGMPLHGIVFTLEFFRVLGDGGGVSPSGKRVPTSLPPDQRVLRGLARNAVLALIRQREEKKGEKHEDVPAHGGEQEKPKKLSCGSVGLKKRQSVAEGDVGILEPIMRVEVHFTEAGYAGEVVRTLHERRALWIDISNSSLERGGTIEALVPMRRLTNYSSALRAAVKGHATLSVHLHSYQLVREESVRRKILKNRGC